MKTETIVSLLLCALTFGTLAPASADPYCRPCPFDCRDLGLGNKDCSELQRSRSACCVDLTSKGLRLAQEQDRVNAGDSGHGSGGGYDNRQDRCPPGFHPSEQKCSQEERRRGCKDIRTPSGLGCVNR